MNQLKRIDIKGQTPRDRLMDYVSQRGGSIECKEIAVVDAVVAIRCAKGHRWRTRGSKLVSEQTWCPQCADERQRLGIEECRDIARARGGLCLSKEYQNVHTLMAWQCGECSDVFNQTVNEITQKNQWCPQCRQVEKRLQAKGKKRSFEELCGELKEAGIEHIGRARALHRKTKWRCQCGFEFEASGQNMLKRKPENRCKSCAGTEPPTIESVQDEARRRGGRCLSEVYVNNREPLEFECEAGHRWWAKWSNVGSNGSWCPKC